MTSVHISDIASWCNIDFKNPSSNPLCNHGSLCINGKPIRHLTIPNGVEKIGDNAFHSCSSLVSVKIGNSVKHIGEMVFICCENLTSVKIGDGVETISNSAFVGSHIKTIELGKNLKNIGPMVFEFCNVNKVVCHAEEPPLVAYNNLGAMIPILYVPKHSIRKYKLTEAWGGCEKILPIK